MISLDRFRLQQWAEEEIRRLRATLPEAIAHRIGNLTVLFEEAPDSIRISEGVEPDALGLFEGPDLTEEGCGTLPPRMTLYLVNLWNEADGNPCRFREEVRRTFLHELGHFLGLSESALADRDLE